MTSKFFHPLQYGENVASSITLNLPQNDILAQSALLMFRKTFTSIIKIRDQEIIILSIKIRGNGKDPHSLLSFSLPLFFSLSLPLFFSLSPSFFFSLSPSFSLSLFLSFSISPSLSPSFYPSYCVSMDVFIFVSKQ